MDGKPNFGHLETDEHSGLPFIVCVSTKRRLYKMPPCRICGIAHYSYSNKLTDECGSCRPDRREANDLDFMLG